MIKVDISNVWGQLSLPNLLAVEKEVAAAHTTLTDGSGEGNDFLGWLNLPVAEPTEEIRRIQAAARRPVEELEEELNRQRELAGEELTELLSKLLSSHAANFQRTSTLTHALELAKCAEPSENTGNKWEQASDGKPDVETWRISNEVFRFTISMRTESREETWRTPAYVSWTVVFYMSSNIKGIDKVLVDIKKTFKDGDKALKYYQGRKDFYEKTYFSDGPRPVIPKEFAAKMTVHGFEVPGFRYEH